MHKLPNIYTGLNTKDATHFQTRVMEEVSFYLAMRGFILRTRPVDNFYQNGLADFFATKVAKKNRHYGEVYSGVSGGFSLPGYNPIDASFETWEKAQNIAKRHCPDWHLQDDDIQKQMTLNIFLLFGTSLDLRSAFLLYNYPALVNDRVMDHAIRVAKTEGIKIFNTANLEVANKILEKIRNDYLASV